MSRDRALVQVNRTFPATSPLVVLLQAAERIGWEGGHEAAERAPGQEPGEDGRGSAFEIVDYRCKDAADRMRACLRRPSAGQPPSERVGERVDGVERVDEACSQETVVEESGGVGVGAGVREPTPPLWEQVGRSWYAEEWETTAETHAESAETHAEKMDITFLLRNEEAAQVDAVQEDVQREELEREMKRENKMLEKKVRALEAVVDYARCLS